MVSESNSADVNAGNTETTDVYAPTGSVYTVLNTKLTVANPGGTTGNHRLQILTAQAIGTLYGKSAYSASLTFQYGSWQTASLDKQPSDPVVARDIERTLKATENEPLRITYVNDSDTTQTNSRDYEFVFEEVSY